MDESLFIIAIDTYELNPQYISYIHRFLYELCLLRLTQVRCPRYCIYTSDIEMTSISTSQLLSIQLATSQSMFPINKVCTQNNHLTGGVCILFHSYQIPNSEIPKIIRVISVCTELSFPHTKIRDIGSLICLVPLFNVPKQEHVIIDTNKPIHCTLSYNCCEDPFIEEVLLCPCHGAIVNDKNAKLKCPITSLRLAKTSCNVGVCIGKGSHTLAPVNVVQSVRLSAQQVDSSKINIVGKVNISAITINGIREVVGMVTSTEQGFRSLVSMMRRENIALIASRKVVLNVESEILVADMQQNVLYLLTLPTLQNYLFNTFLSSEDEECKDDNETKIYLNTLPNIPFNPLEIQEAILSNVEVSSTVKNLLLKTD